MECLTQLVGIKNLCSDTDSVPYFFLDDAESVDRLSLSQISKPTNGSGKEFGLEIIDSASRFLVADIETLIPKGYSVKSSLNSFCNTCTYTGLTTSSTFTGVVVKNISISKNAYLVIDSLKVMLQSTGTFTIILDDGVTPKQIPFAFTAGRELVVTNINYKTVQKSVKVYFLEDTALLVALNCPTTKSCGCSGSVTKTDLQVKGLLDGSEFTTQYSFIPCASVVCSLDMVICNIVNQQPRLFALALFYRATARYFSEFGVTQRNNRNASFNEDEKISLSEQYMGLYYERLRGSQNVKGIGDNMAAVLNNLNDVCVDCARKTGVSWATG